MVRYCFPFSVTVNVVGDESSAETDENSAVEVGVLIDISKSLSPRSLTLTVVGARASADSSCCNEMRRSLTSPPNRRGPRVSQGDEFVGTEGNSRRTTNSAA